MAELDEIGTVEDTKGQGSNAQSNPETAPLKGPVIGADVGLGAGQGAGQGAETSANSEVGPEAGQAFETGAAPEVGRGVGPSAGPRVGQKAESQAESEPGQKAGQGAGPGVEPGNGSEPTKSVPWHLKQLNGQREKKQKKTDRPKKKMNLQLLAYELAKVYVFYFLLSFALLYFLKDYLALFPYQDQDWKPMLADLDQKVQAKTEILTIPGPEGSTLSAVYTKSLAPGSHRLVVISHGNAGNVGHRLGIAAYFAACGVSSLNYDYRGFGESTGKAHLVGLVDDGLAAYNYAKTTLGYKESDIILYGESIGCGIATGIMQKNHPGAVILQSPFTSLKTAARDKLFFLWCLPEFLMPPPALDNLTAVKGEHPPLLIMHGEKDVTLPPRYSKELYAAAREPKELFIVKNADHNDVYSDPNSGLLAELKKFVDSLK